MKKGNLVLSGIFTALAVFIIAMSLQLPPTKNGVPGPGSWPVLIAVVMLVAAVSEGIKALAVPDTTPLVLGTSDQVRVYISMGCLVIYLLGMYYIGFCTATFIMLFSFISWFGSYRLFIRIVTALSITVIVYVVFQYVLKVPFRFGILI